MSKFFKTKKQEKAEEDNRAKLRREGKIPPPVHHLPTVKRRNGWRWRLRPY